MNITKRNGKTVPANTEYIRRAIKKAFDSDKISVSDRELNQIINRITLWDNIHVEDIQDQIIEVLTDMGYNTTAESYAQYREARRVLREHKDKLTKEIGAKLLAINVENSNANMDENSFGGRMGEAASAAAKDYALNYCMSEMSRDNHLNNEIYIHDLNSYAIGQPNCLTLPLEKMFAHVIKTRQTDIRPANSFSTAMQLLAVYFQIQSLQQFGGVAASCLDWDLVPYIRKSFYKHWCDGQEWIGDGLRTGILDVANISIEDPMYKQNPKVYAYAVKMLNREVKQSIEAMFHNLNSLQSRSGEI